MGGSQYRAESIKSGRPRAPQPVPDGGNALFLTHCEPRRDGSRQDAGNVYATVRKCGCSSSRRFAPEGHTSNAVSSGPSGTFELSFGYDTVQFVSVINGVCKRCND